MEKSPKLKSGRNPTTTLSTNRVELNRIIRCSTNVLLNKSKILKSQDIEWDRQIPGEWDQNWHITLQNTFVKISDWHTSYVFLLVQQAKIVGSLHEHCVNVKCWHLQRTCRIIQARYSGYIRSSSRSNDQFVQGVSRNNGQIFCQINQREIWWLHGCIDDYRRDTHDSSLEKISNMVRNEAWGSISPDQEHIAAL